MAELQFLQTRTVFALPVSTKVEVIEASNFLHVPSQRQRGNQIRHCQCRETKGVKLSSLDTLSQEHSGPGLLSLLLSLCP